MGKNIDTINKVLELSEKDMIYYQRLTEIEQANLGFNDEYKNCLKKIKEIRKQILEEFRSVEFDYDFSVLIDKVAFIHAISVDQTDFRTYYTLEPAKKLYFTFADLLALRVISDGLTDDQFAESTNHDVKEKSFEEFMFDLMQLIDCGYTKEKRDPLKEYYEDKYYDEFYGEDFEDFRDFDEDEYEEKESFYDENSKVRSRYEYDCRQLHLQIFMRYLIKRINETKNEELRNKLIEIKYSIIYSNPSLEESLIDDPTFSEELEVFSGRLKEIFKDYEGSYIEYFKSLHERYRTLLAILFNDSLLVEKDEYPDEELNLVLVELNIKTTLSCFMDDDTRNLFVKDIKDISPDTKETKIKRSLAKSRNLNKAFNQKMEQDN